MHGGFVPAALQISREVRGKHSAPEGGVGCFVCLVGVLSFLSCSDVSTISVVSGRVADSAGVAIVISTPDDAAYAHVAQAPSLRMGAIDGAEPFLFENIVSVARDMQHNLVVADAGSLEIRVFDDGGNHVKTMGGRGEGPGEFQWFDGMWTVDDGKIVVANGLPPARITQFGSDGVVTEHARLTGIESSPLPILTPLGLVGTGSMVSMVEHLVYEDHRKPFRAPVLFLRHRLDGFLIDTIARLPGRPGTVLAAPNRTASGMGLPPLPMSVGPTAAGSPDGIAITSGEDYEVRFFDTSGTLRRIMRLTEAPPLRTSAHMRQYAIAMVRNTCKRYGVEFEADCPSGEERMVTEQLEFLHSLPLMDRLPGYVQLHYADTGELWALRYGLRSAPERRWDVFGLDGSHLGYVDVPGALNVYGIRHAQIFGVTRDELGVERIEIRELEVVTH